MECPNPNLVEGAKTYSKFNAERTLEVLSKAIMLGEEVPSYVAISELALMRRVGCTAVLERTYHNLALLSASYLGIGNFLLCIDVMKECSLLQQVKEGEVLAKCHSIVEMLRYAPKNHLTPLLWNAYCNRLNVGISRSVGLRTMSTIEDATLLGWRTNLHNNAVNFCRNRGLDPRNSQMLVAFHVYFHEGSIECLSILGMMLEEDRIPKSSHRGARTAPSLITHTFEVLRTHLSDATLELFQHWYQVRKHPYFAVTCVVAALHELSQYIPSEGGLPKSVVKEEDYITFKAKKLGAYPDDSKLPLVWPKWEPVWYQSTELEKLELIAEKSVHPRP